MKAGRRVTNALRACDVCVCGAVRSNLPSRVQCYLARCVFKEHLMFILFISQSSFSLTSTTNIKASPTEHVDDLEEQQLRKVVARKRAWKYIYMVSYCNTTQQVCNPRNSLTSLLFVQHCMAFKTSRFAFHLATPKRFLSVTHHRLHYGPYNDFYSLAGGYYRVHKCRYRGPCPSSSESLPHSWAACSRSVSSPEGEDKEVEESALLL